MNSSKHLDLGPFGLLAGDEWEDITDSLSDPNAPFTLARPARGVGALQFSPAVHRSGPVPSPSVEDLEALLARFAVRHGFGEQIDIAHFSHTVYGVGASFRSGDDLVRVWYVSDGKNIMLITYICEWSDRLHETGVCDEMVKSITFNE
jgi:hypothetical protein